MKQSANAKYQILEDKIKLLEEALEEKNLFINQLQNENKQLIKENLDLILNCKLK